MTIITASQRRWRKIELDLVSPSYRENGAIVERKVDAVAGKRRVLGIVVGSARAIGFSLILLAILSLPQLHFISDSMREGIRTLSSVALGVLGILLLLAVRFFLRFFDQFLSRY